MFKQATLAVLSLVLCAGLAQASTHKAAPEMKADCEKQADEKKLAGAARNSFVKKCSAGDAAKAAVKSPATEGCEKQAADKKLAGAAKNSFVKKCVRDADAKKS
jgi:hypothetical protein